MCDEKIDLTFAQMSEVVQKSANIFSNLGVTKGTNVAILGESQMLRCIPKPGHLRPIIVRIERLVVSRSIYRNPLQDFVMAKPNYGYEKRQRDLAKKKKKEEKRLKKLAAKAAAADGTAMDATKDSDSEE